MRTNVVYLGNAFELLKRVDDSSVDLVILDPNYQDWPHYIRLGIIAEALRVIKDTGNIICFTQPPFDHLLRVAVDKWFKREIIWSFKNGGAWVSHREPLRYFQKIFWLTKTNTYSYQKHTGLPYSRTTRNFKRTTKDFKDWHKEGRQFTMSELGTCLGDHMTFPKPRGKKPYVAAKPQQLIDVIIRCLCPEGGIVLDPFLGSGTTVDVCKEQNKLYIGMEMNPELESIIIQKVTT